MNLLQKTINFFYPSLCLHCETPLASSHLLVCSLCSSHFSLIDPILRCLYCFSEKEGGRLCVRCLSGKRPVRLKMAAALDYQGAVRTLVRHLKNGKHPYLAKAGAAFLTAQFFRLGWPLPDYITAVPSRHWFQGRNHAILLAKQFAYNLEIPFLLLVKRKSGAFSQARLSQKQRESLSSSQFYLASKARIEEKTILIIDDVMTTGSTLRCVAESLSDGFPDRIFCMSLARSIRD